MNERLIKNWITTLMGIALFATGVIFVMNDKMPWYGMIAFSIASGWLMYAKDANFKKAFNKLNPNKK